MTDSMIERVANAIYAAFQAPGLAGNTPRTIADLSANYAEMYRQQARAAIAAMRLPTEAMHEAGSRFCQECADSLDAWHAMIDTALKEL